jgi:tetratricopeptide (TPR) repeat protein
MLVQERRVRLHREVLHALEARLAGGTPEAVEVLAHHATRGESWERAARYLYDAGERALSYAATNVAMDRFEACIEAVDRYGAAGDRRLKLDAMLELWVTRIDTPTRRRGMRKLAADADALATELGDAPRLARVRLLQSQALGSFPRSQADLETAIELAQAAATLAATDDVRTRSYAAVLAAMVLRDLGALRNALAAYDRGIALFEAGNVSRLTLGLVLPIHATLCSWRADALATLGNFAAALHSAGTGVQIAQDISHPLILSIGYAYLGSVYLERGEVESAVPRFEKGLTIADDNRATYGLIINGHALALALATLGHSARARTVLDRLREAGPAATSSPRFTRYHALPGAARLAIGDLDGALIDIDEGLRLTGIVGVRGYRPALLRLRALVIARMTDAEVRAAATLCQQALDIAVELEMRPEEVRCRIDLGRFCRDLGDVSRAHDHLSTAASLASSLSMSRHHDEAMAGLQSG